MPPRTNKQSNGASGANLGFEAKLWLAADKLRNNMDAGEHKHVVLGHDMAMNQTCYGLSSKVSAPFALCCHARHFMEQMVHAAHGSVFDTITTRTFETTAVCLAPSSTLAAFDGCVSSLFQHVRANLLQCRKLTAVRASLLPQLLSGKSYVLDRNIE